MFAEDGWVEVSQQTLRHPRYANVFAVGDIAGVPKGKTAASVKWQVPVAAAHILADIQGKQSDAVYNGYTSCPLITRLGRAMLVEFDYKNNLTPSLPLVKPLQDSYFAWLLKYRLFKPSYMAVAKGRL